MMTATSLQQEQLNQLEDGNNAIVTRARTPLQIKGNNAIVTRAMMPAQQQQGRLRFDNGNGAIVMRATITIATMAKMPTHQWQQLHCNKGKNAIAMLARIPAHQ
jgi:hypothetical protein